MSTITNHSDLCQFLRDLTQLLLFTAMKTILVPTDFSKGAEAALDFAIQTARQQKARLLLFNAFSGRLPYSSLPYELIAEESRRTASGVEKQMQSLCLKIDYAGDVQYDFILKEGPAIASILKIANDYDIDLIVMGTRGESRVLDMLMGSTTSGVIAEASCPVIAVPPHVFFNNTLKKITYASNLLETDIEAIRSVVELARPVNAIVSILHVADPGAEPEMEVKRLNEFMDLVEKRIAYSRFSCELLSGKTPIEALQDYMIARKSDVLVLSTARRNLMQKLFAGSITKDLIKDAPVPVIAFHHRKHSKVRLYI